MHSALGSSVVGTAGRSLSAACGACRWSVAHQPAGYLCHPHESKRAALVGPPAMWRWALLVCGLCAAPGVATQVLRRALGHLLAVCEEGAHRHCALIVTLLQGVAQPGSAPVIKQAVQHNTRSQGLCTGDYIQPLGHGEPVRQELPMANEAVGCAAQHVAAQGLERSAAPFGCARTAQAFLGGMD